MAKKFVSYREESKTNWGANLEEGAKLDRDQIKLGAALRIADSLEKIAEPYVDLLSEVKRLRESIERKDNTIHRLTNSITTYKANSTRFRKKIADLEQKNGEYLVMIQNLENAIAQAKVKGGQE